jgi:hypothetical protein
MESMTSRMVTSRSSLEMMGIWQRSASERRNVWSCQMTVAQALADFRGNLVGFFQVQPGILQRAGQER